MIDADVLNAMDLPAGAKLQITYHDENDVCRENRIVSYRRHTDDVLLVCGAYNYSIPFTQLTRITKIAD